MPGALTVCAARNVDENVPAIREIENNLGTKFSRRAVKAVRWLRD